MLPSLGPGTRLNGSLSHQGHVISQMSVFPEHEGATMVPQGLIAGRVSMTSPDPAVTWPHCLYPDFYGMSSVAKSVSICMGTDFMSYVNIYLKRNKNSNIEHKNITAPDCVVYPHPRPRL